MTTILEAIAARRADDEDAERDLQAYNDRAFQYIAAYLQDLLAEEYADVPDSAIRVDRTYTPGATPEYHIRLTMTREIYGRRIPITFHFRGVRTATSVVVGNATVVTRKLTLPAVGLTVRGDEILIPVDGYVTENNLLLFAQNVTPQFNLWLASAPSGSIVSVNAVALKASIVTQAASMLYDERFGG